MYCISQRGNQLWVDEYGLAGFWLSDALNTNIHTFEVAPAFIAIEHSLLAYIWQGLQIRSTRQT